MWEMSCASFPSHNNPMKSVLLFSASQKAAEIPQLKFELRRRLGSARPLMAAFSLSRWPLQVWGLSLSSRGA